MTATNNGSNQELRRPRLLDPGRRHDGTMLTERILSIATLWATRGPDASIEPLSRITRRRISGGRVTLCAVRTVGGTRAAPTSTQESALQDWTGPRLGGYPLQLPRLTDPRLHLATVTITLQVLGQTVFDFTLSIAQILISIGTCAAIELVVSFRRTRIIAWPASAMLTGNGIALLMRAPGTEHGDWWSLTGWWVFAGTAALAMASKYLIRSGGPHIFNPSNFALVVAFLVLGEARADPQVLWWGPLSPGLVLAFAVILAGSAAITRRVKQLHSAVSFWVVFAAATALIAASGHSITANWHIGPISGWDYWVLLVTSPEILVFLFFMITDPKTAPAGRVAQSVYGTAIALIGALIIATQSGEFGTKVGILVGLVVLCPFVALIERRTPAARTDGDTLRSWLVGPSAGSRVVNAVAPRRLGALATIGATVGATVLVLGSLSDNSANTTVDLELRAQVSIDEGALPDVSLGDTPGTSVQLTPELAQEMGRGLAVSLEVERQAFLTADAELAAAGASGTRLAQNEARIEASGGEPLDATSREFATLTAAFMRSDGGPQTPPELAVRATGTLTADGGATEPFDATFTLVAIDGVHLITNEYDADGEPVGDQSIAAGGPSIEAPITIESPEATDAQLAGLRFSDVTEQVGLDVAHSNGPQREGPAAMAGGATVGDYDSDGDPDVLLTRVGLPNVLFRNDGGRFTDVTEAAGLIPADLGGGAAGPGSAEQSSTGATFVDVSGDGVLDLITLGLGSTTNRLFLGGPQGFTDATAEWGLPTDTATDPDAATFSLAASDYDGNGTVDLIITESDPYRVAAALEAAEVPGGDPCGTAARAVIDDLPSAPSRTRLLSNTGTGFEDRTDRLGVDPSKVLAMTPRFVDLDGDDRDDLLISGQACTSKVLRNDGNGGFVDVTADSGASDIETGIGSEMFDADGDGELDWFVTGVSYPTRSGDCPLTDPMLGCTGNRLFLSDGDGTFTEVTDRYGLRDGYWGAGAVAADVNLDGRMDLFAANGFRNAVTDAGRSRPDWPLYDRSAESPNQLWLNTGAAGDESVTSDPDAGSADESRWPEVAEQVGLGSASNSAASVPLDYDGDGLIDVLVVDSEGGPALLRNKARNDHGSLTLSVEDPTTPNRLGVGATVRATLSNGGVLVRRVGAGGSFQSGDPTAVHLGLGDARVREVAVRWHGGDTQRFTDLTAGDVLTRVGS